MQNWQLGCGSLWGSLSHTWQLERHSPRTVSFDSPSNKWKIAGSCCPAEAHAHSSVHSLQHLEPHTLASKMQVAHFPAAQSDHSPLLEKVQWKAAVVIPRLFYTAETLAKGTLWLPSVKGAEEKLNQTSPGLALSAGMKWCTSSHCSHSLCVTG